MHIFSDSVTAVGLRSLVCLVSRFGIGLSLVEAVGGAGNGVLYIPQVVRGKVVKLKRCLLFEAQSNSMTCRFPECQVIDSEICLNHSISSHNSLVQCVSRNIVTYLSGSCGI